jgi:predicted MFS family arabinose efflux permease
MRHYLTSTISYWAFTLTDGALRMLVVLHFHQLGYGPLAIAMLFLFYEVFGIVTNLIGGLLAARIGLAWTQMTGLALQVAGLGLLLVSDAPGVALVMFAQALSGIAKDLNKLSAKSGVKFVVPEGADPRLYRAVAWLTGSKNLLKGVGFFLGGWLLAQLGFASAVTVLLALLIGPLLLGLWGFDRALGRTTFKPKFRQLLSKSPRINWLSGARCLLFGARDVWFVVAVPVYLQSVLGWSSTAVGTLLAGWIIGYGVVQMLAPAITGTRRGKDTGAAASTRWGAAMTGVPVLLAAVLVPAAGGGQTAPVLIAGLLVFGALFAVNSAIHSYLIVRFAAHDGVSLDVGFYYMSNAAGRLLGTVLSGAIYQNWGLAPCLVASSVMLLLATLASARLERLQPASEGAA